MYDECVNLRTQRRYTVLQVFTRLTSQHACIWENEKARHSGEGKGDRKEKKKVTERMTIVSDWPLFSS